MKINELLIEEQVLIDHDKIDQWVMRYVCTSSLVKYKRDFFSINDKGFVNTYHSVRILTNHKALPVKFGTINGSFTVNGCGLTTMIGFPRIIRLNGISYVSAKNNKFITIDGITEDADEIIFNGCPIRSLKNIHKQIKRVKKLFISGSVKQDILGLILIPDLKLVVVQDDKKSKGLEKAVKIINNHLGKGRSGVLDAQNELIDEGLDAFAEI